MNTNSSIIMYALILFFITSGLVIGFLELKLNDTKTDFSTDDLISTSKTEVESASSLRDISNIGQILITILKMATWSFGSLPVLVELLLFVPIRFLFWILTVKTVTGGS